MRIVPVAFAVAALAALTMPALAKNAKAEKSEDKSDSSTCSAYQQTPDGSWTQLPCQEAGAHGQTQTQHRPASQGSDQEER